MPALLALWGVLVAIGEILLDLWAVLVEFMPWLAKIGPWLAGLLPLIPAIFRKVIAWWGMDTIMAVKQGAFAMFVRVALMTAWGVLLAALTNGILGLGIKDYCLQNPFSGIPGSIMFLVNAGFPIKFGLGLVTSYIVFRLTLNQAALVMARTVKFLFGA